ncbi:hypothetical protein BDV39DRAFT_175187 [Aspergillus sergii]|uniref:Uncharacterized protein n=1 Tax=Aspergillus sergii TaxID=1034303 RepID=A0A5N6X5S5_9EURO|nr:hypothetical protein BDV39DRAFT_175187 [Aspergillus sergii]
MSHITAVFKLRPTSQRAVGCLWRSRNSQVLSSVSTSTALRRVSFLWIPVRLRSAPSGLARITSWSLFVLVTGRMRLALYINRLAGRGGLGLIPSAPSMKTGWMSIACRPWE